MPRYKLRTLMIALALGPLVMLPAGNGTRPANKRRPRLRWCDFKFTASLRNPPSDSRSPLITKAQKN
jgi:hypothetical protein